MKRAFLTIAVLATLALAGHGQGTPPPGVWTPSMTYYTVAKDGDASGTGQTFSMFSRVSVARVMSEDHVAFHANSTAGRGVWTQNVTGGGLLTNVAMGGFTVAGSCGTIGTIDQGFPPNINGAGQVAFFCTMSCGGTSSPQSILLKPSPVTSLVLMAQVNGGPPSTPYTGLNRDFGLGATGEIGFAATDTAGQGVWKTSSGSFSKIAQTNDLAPGGAASEKFDLFINSGIRVPQYDGALTSAFRAQLKDGIATVGVYRGTPSSITFIADDEHNAPGIVPSAKFSEFYAVAVNSSGTTAFRAKAANSFKPGIWKGASNPSLGAVALHNQPAPGRTGSSPSIGTFLDFSDPDINDSGHTAFRADLVGGLEGIWAENLHAQGLLLIALEGDQLRGTNFAFKSFDTDLALNNAGQLAFTGTVTDGVQDRRGLFFVTPETQTVFRIVLGGDYFDVGTPGTPDIRQIRFNDGIDFYPGSVEQGVAGFTHEGSLAYRLIFYEYDNSDAVILTTIDNT